MSAYKSFLSQSSKQNVIQAQTEHLLDRGWTHRSWTLPEITLASNPIVMCGREIILWEDVINAFSRKFERPNGYSSIFGTKNEASVPDSAQATVANWQTIIDLWLSFSRPVSGDTATQFESTKNSVRTQLRILSTTGKGTHVRARRAFGVIFYPSFLVWFCLWAFVSYEAWASAHGIVKYCASKGPVDNNVAFCRVWNGALWFLATLVYLFIFGVFTIDVDYVTMGYGCHDWIFKTSEEDGILMVNAVRLSLGERASSRPHDKVFANFGILTAGGAMLGKPDYSNTVGRAYQAFLENVLHWQEGSLTLLVDAGGRLQQDRPSWVPNWEDNWEARVSGWLTSKPSLGQSQHAALLSRVGNPQPAFRIVGNKLALRGRKLGRIRFCASLLSGDIKSNVTTGGGEDDGDHKPILAAALFLLKTWLDVVQKRRFRPRIDNSLPDDRVLVPILFGVLEGLNPPCENTNQSEWESSYGLSERPYDFGGHRNDLWNFEALYSILKTVNLDTDHQVGVAGGGSMTATTLLQEIKSQAHQEVPADPERSDYGNCWFVMIILVLELLFWVMERVILRVPKPAKEYKDPLGYLKKVAHTLRRDKRGLFVLSNGCPGTGPLDVEEGDEVFLLAGVPAPMVLRPVIRGGIEGGEGGEGGGQSGRDKYYYRVVGASLVHGVMNGEEFEHTMRGMIPRPLGEEEEVTLM